MRALNCLIFGNLFLVFGSDIFIDLGQILKDKKAAKIIKVKKMALLP